MNKKQKSLTNKGFSLVELIIVIAIMAVLVGVLAPQFLKYVEQSRKSKDIQTAANLQTAYLTDIADSEITTDANKKKIAATTDLPSTVKTIPTVSGTEENTDKNFYVTYSVNEGTCSVYVLVDGTYYDLTTETDAKTYKGL